MRSNCDLLTFEDLRMIRVSLLGLVKFYLTKDVSHTEMMALVSFLVATRQEQMVLEMLDMLIALLESSSVKDQFFLLIFEPGCAELLYSILLNKEFAADKAKGKVLKILQYFCANIYKDNDESHHLSYPLIPPLTQQLVVVQLIHLLLKTDRVYEKGKTRLRLHDIGLPGLLALLPQTSDFATQLMDLTLLTGRLVDYTVVRTDPYGLVAADTAPAYQGALAILLAVPCTNLDLKLEILEKVGFTNCLNRVNLRSCLLYPRVI
ncbi:NBEAL1 [Cordylochernes scorpioides]|uniref:NBEAL1 n=1 Tax=Cordylochernes scorpioides TaxID=51811 RepID=A0ABY6LA29_9ARAC|nr:NBEAL1 [Cordylochernes scorpioides]